MAKEAIDLSIIIVSYNTKKLTRECIESVVKFTKGIAYEFLVMDNASRDGSVKMLTKLARKLPLTLVANKENVGFGAGNNQGMKRAKGRYLLLLNSDTVVKDNVLGEMVDWMEKHPQAGIASCALRNADGSLQGTGGYFPTLFKVFAWMFFLEDVPLLAKLIKPYHPMHPKSPFYKGEDFFTQSHQRDWVTGAFFLFRKEVLSDVGLFSQDYFMYVEEVDYCFRAKEESWQVWFLPDWSIIHYGGASGTSELAILSEFRGLKIFFKKYLPAWQMPILRLFLKAGAFLRIFIFGKVYAKAFREI